MPICGPFVGLLVLAAVVAVLATEEASADHCGQSAVCRRVAEKLQAQWQAERDDIKAERDDLQRRLDGAENTRGEVAAAKNIDLGQGEANIGGVVSGIVTTMAPACTALHCPLDGYVDNGEFFSWQLSEGVGRGGGRRRYGNDDKVIKTLENLVENDGIVSTKNGGSSFQMNFETRVDNKFRITGCNSPTGTSCSVDTAVSFKSAGQSGFLHDTGAAFGTHGDHKYGWMCDGNPKDQTRGVRGWGNHMDRYNACSGTTSWQLKVLNGHYDIKVTMPKESHQGCKVQGESTGGEYGNFMYEKSITVTDGTVTISGDFPSCHSIESVFLKPTGSGEVEEERDACAAEVTTNFKVCPSDPHSPVSECGKCEHGHALLAQSVQLLTDIPACHTWFVKADAVIRSITTHRRTFWLVDRINLCKDYTP